MIQKIIIFKHPYGLHMRPAMLITDEAIKFNCNITIHKKEISADAKSIFQVMMLGVEQNDDITIIAEGEDEQESIDALEELIINILPNIKN